MSSTQHQLIEQCATRLRGIVEALDNIHDTSPHRWSTDLDDVHSSAESLLALIKDQAPARSEASFEEWLANELEGEDGQPVPAAVCDIALARRAFNHWPKLEHPAKVGGVRFSAGVSSRLVVEAAQRLYEFESTPEQEAERPEVVAYRTIGRHEKHQHPHYALNYYKQNAEDQATHWRERGCEVSEDELMTVAQHERIVGALRAKAAQLREALEWRAENQAGQRELLRSVTAERDAALARVEQQERTIAGINEAHAKLAGLYEAAQAQHSAGYAEARQCVNCRHIGINDAADYAACHDCRWTGPEPDEDKCPGCAGENCMAAACPECGGRYELVAEAKISTPAAQAGQVPQAWLDVQAERRRQVEAEGWTPEHDDEHDSGEIACAAACYALPPAHPARIEGALGRYGRDPNIWPWTRDWWKPAPNDRRRELIKAGALVLAEIERLDRAAATQGGPRDA
ncbi:hypothetical protein [Pseudomonas aeruginosa]|uniref:hypothetical protein n=1 Tax=Pseudomonas aeruginosa TaxID=287 RepID=UPI001C529B65|nr:hypothetical protein [Pseudomonas aeruginosa]MCS7612200.1 hypothetical protein [Pseudomonas aeruginosa]HBO3538844.1 hypothetical protein [Pseudomonas aeruginosa]HBO3942280.1 hypothetical protein [Pseudomonas aeruginosa]HBO4037142.1 hypothetical protein [Pseudomonas aeruginosa]HBO4112288.1 hypothetical protein [Pseudomonas aeruginosa]